MRIDINYRLTAPLSHIGETASTGSYFQTILTADGKLPVITGNSIRGQIRNSGAEFLLKTVGESVDKEVFHVLFSGGNLNGIMRNDVEKSLKIREMFPLISVLGAGVGDMIMAGKTNFSFAYPVCKESYNITKKDSDVSWHKQIDEIEFTRTDDEKNDSFAHFISDVNAEKQSKASTQMRYSVQYLAVGTELVQSVYLFDCRRLELGALLSAFSEWWKRPVLGGMSNKGFGFFDAFLTFENNTMSVNNGIIVMSNEIKEAVDEYCEYIIKSNCKNSLNLLKGGKPDVKKANRAAKSDGNIN